MTSGRLALAALFALLAGSALAQGLPSGLSKGSNSKPDPVVEGGTVSFTIHRGVCTSRPYGDGRGESNCSNKNVQSYLGTGRSLEARRGQAWRYAFEFWIDPRTNHRGHHSPDAAPFTGQGVNNSRLEIARWQGQGNVRNHIYDIEVDRTRGVTFLGRRCAGPESFGRWQRFEMQVRWSNDATGAIVVRCNGKAIYGADGIATDQAPHCHIANHCEPGKVKHPARIYFQFGAFHDPVWPGGRREWAPIPEGGLTFRFRNVEIGRL